jgi:hypothetical protein
MVRPGRLIYSYWNTYKDNGIQPFSKTEADAEIGPLVQIVEEAGKLGL